MPSIVILSCGAALIALAGFLIVNRVIKPINLEEHRDFLDAMLNIVGTLVSILLGLLVAAALDRYHSLEGSVDSEAANIAQIYRLTFGVPGEARFKIRALCQQYTKSVLTDEWPKMAEGKDSKETFLAYARMVTTIAKFRPANDGESNVHAAMISALQQAGDARRQRLLSLHSNWNQNLLPILLICSMIVLAFTYLYVKRGEVFHGVLICFVAIALGSNLGLVFLLNNPFSGDWKIQPRGFEMNKQLTDALKGEPELKELVDKEDKESK